MHLILVLKRGYYTDIKHTIASIVCLRTSSSCIRTHLQACFFFNSVKREVTIRVWSSYLFCTQKCICVLCDWYIAIINSPIFLTYAIDHCIGLMNTCSCTKECMPTYTVFFKIILSFQFDVSLTRHIFLTAVFMLVMMLWAIPFLSIKKYITRQKRYYIGQTQTNYTTAKVRKAVNV